MRRTQGGRILAITVLSLSCLLFAPGAYCQDQEYKEHTVTRGETLWTISSKEITDPFLWPKVWKENPEVRNPDLIYPGQRIRIPLSLIQKEVAPKPVEKVEPGPEVKPETKTAEEPAMKKITPVMKKYLVDQNTLISSGYIADSITIMGEIIGAPTERGQFGGGDDIYIRTVAPVKAGDRFYVMRSAGKVRHPETGAKMGDLIEITGIVEVVGTESGQTKAKVTASFAEVAVGDVLDNYYEMEQPFLIDNPRTFSVNGFIVATRERHDISSQSDIVFIDKGRSDGVEIGDMIPMISRNTFDVPNGTIQIIGMKEKTATAIVVKSNREVKAGDRIGKP